MLLIKTRSTNFVPFVIYFLVLNFNHVSLVYNPACWELNVIPFTISPAFSKYQYDYIQQMMGLINKKTCIIWSDRYQSVPLQNLTSFVSFERGINGTCQTVVQNPLKVVITLADGCFQDKHVLHELLHAMGFLHEHQRVDRDCYVFVWKSAKKEDNDKMPSFPNIDTFPYDKGSLMHYRRSNYMKSRRERLYKWEPLGNDEEILTEMDLWKIQYRFCGRPHYCDVNPGHCFLIEKMESEMNCVAKT